MAFPILTSDEEHALASQDDSPCHEAGQQAEVEAGQQAETAAPEEKADTSTNKSITPNAGTKELQAATLVQAETEPEAETPTFTQLKGVLTEGELAALKKAGQVAPETETDQSNSQQKPDLPCLDTSRAQAKEAKAKAKVKAKAKAKASQAETKGKRAMKRPSSAHKKQKSDDCSQSPSEDGDARNSLADEPEEEEEPPIEAWPTRKTFAGRICPANEDGKQKRAAFYGNVPSKYWRDDLEREWYKLFTLEKTTKQAVDEFLQNHAHE